MQAVHDYAVPLRRLLCRCCDILDSENENRARFFFTRISLAESTLESLYTRLETVDAIYQKSLASQ
ncbi:hypothetical protein BKA66DRAFT_465344 [Pyrenochaeta sp. MPI-SDFR-AT-0127]|nr:hypothetical protein BKA66DRAFT_465344 [Pyrenochaeta sp. MPI-SDFR-AT-0127]